MITVEDLKPIMLYLPESDFRERMTAGLQYFNSQGINPHLVWGVHSGHFGIAGTHPYLQDDPNRTIPQGPKDIGSYLSHYIIYNVIHAMEHEYVLILEDDARFVDGWREKLNQALKDVPQDFDILMVGNCCAQDKNKVRIAGDVWEIKYPQCGHCYIMAKKAVGVILATQRDTANPTDISLNMFAFPHLKVYTCLPRLAEQHNNYNLPK